MSRNLCCTDCHQCDGEVILEEEARPATKDEVHEPYVGMRVANARCERCEALYLAWCGPSPYWTPTFVNDKGFYDLSYRSAFNDEPNPEDLPIWRVDQFGVRVGLITDPNAMSYFRSSHIKDDDTSNYAEFVRASQQRWWLRRTAAAEARPA